MDIAQVIILALIQGITEFLPISSSAHLILVAEMTTWEDQGIAFDVAVHVGSLFAVLFYFRQDLKPLLTAWLNSLRSGYINAESRLVWGVILGTIPVAGFGFLLSATDLVENMRSMTLIAITTIIFAILLWYADSYGNRQRSEQQITWLDIGLIGLAQAMALIPGVSRSGITITVALMLGLSRPAAARFSFLLSIPVIILAGTYEGLGLVVTPPSNLDWFSLTLGMLVAAVSAYICIELFIRLLNQIGMLPFVVYRIILGLFLLWI